MIWFNTQDEEINFSFGKVDMIIHNFVRPNGAHIHFKNVFLSCTKRAQYGSSIEGKLREYMKAKTIYDSLLSKYDVFKQKEKSVEYAASVVGLRPPKIDR